MMEIYSQKSVEVSTVNFCLWVILLLIETYFFCLDAYALNSALYNTQFISHTSWH